MKNFKKLTLFVAIATVATSSVFAENKLASRVLPMSHSEVLLRNNVAAIGAAIKAAQPEIAEAVAKKAAQPKSWMSMLPTLPTITLPTLTFPTITLPTVGMPTLNDVQTGLSNAAGFVSTQAQSAGTAVVNTAKSASKTVVNAAGFVSTQAQTAIRQLPSQEVAYKTAVEIAGKKATKGVAFITAALIAGRILRNVQLARDARDAQGEVVATPGK